MHNIPEMSGNETSNINLVPRPAELLARTVSMTMANQVCPKSVSLPSLKAKPREQLSSERKTTDRPRLVRCGRGWLLQASACATAPPIL